MKFLSIWIRLETQIFFISSDMMLFHPYPSGAPLVHPSTHGSVYMHPNLGASRPVFNGGKEESILNLQGVPPSSLYGQAINMVPSLGHQSQTNQKRPRSPSPPPPQLYHSYKPPALSPYNSSIKSFLVSTILIYLLFTFFSREYR